jgi:hypothetical protein
MLSTRTNRLLFLFLFVVLQTNYCVFSQSFGFPITEWVRKLSDKNAPAIAGAQELVLALQTRDSARAKNILNELEGTGTVKDNYFAARLGLAKATWLWNLKNSPAKDSVAQLMKQALNAAYETDNDSLVSAVSWQYGSLMYAAREIEPAAMYCLYSAEINERIDKKMSADQYTLLAGILYITHDFEKSIYYLKLANERQPDTSAFAKGSRMSRYNTIGLCWQKMKKYDSAFFYYNMAMALANETRNGIWQSIIGGNMGQIYFLQKKYALAKPLLQRDYQESKTFGETTSAANSLQWVARINLMEGKKDSALIQIRQAIEMLQPFPFTDSYANYYENLCYAAADIYRAFGKSDSVYKYSELYNKIHDSIDRAVANSRLEISMIKLDNLKNALTIKNLHKEKEAERLTRNFILGFIVMFAAIVILILNRQRQTSFHKEQMALQQKASAEAEVAAAQEQLNMFKQNIVEKTSLIEKLEEQVHHKNMSSEQSEIADELSRQTILTEDDWDKFKRLFEKIYPGFFMKLKDKAPDITLAEQRMAALTRLHLTSKQMASMLGISVDSVHKTRQRLRQRLHLGTDINLEETIGYF